MQRGHVIYNFRFGLLCMSSLFFSTSYNMLIPELPSYLSSLGGSEYIGLIIALFTLTAGLSRPFSGVLTDKIGRKPVMVFGALICVVCGLFYPILGYCVRFFTFKIDTWVFYRVQPNRNSCLCGGYYSKRALGGGIWYSRTLF